MKTSKNMFYQSDSISYIQLFLILLAQGVMFGASVAVLYQMNINYYVIKNSLCGIPCYSFVLIILLIISTFGALLIIKNKKYPLIPLYILFTISVICTLMILSIVGYTGINKINPIIEEQLMDSMSKYLKKEDHIVHFWNDIHAMYNCCGVISFTDWLKYKELNYHLPLSCCDQNYEIADKICTEISTNLRTEGCLKPFVNSLKDYYIIFIIVQFVLAIIQLSIIFYYGTYKCFAKKLKIYRQVSTIEQNSS